VALDVEEVGRAQVLVALGLLRVEAACIDDQLHDWLRAQVERSLIAVKAAPDGDQAKEVAHVKLDARPRRVEAPRAGGDVGHG
jgi:hypothetical protein